MLTVLHAEGMDGRMIAMSSVSSDHQLLNVFQVQALRLDAVLAGLWLCVEWLRQRSPILCVLKELEVV